MANLNLLPWRETQRKQKQQTFIILLSAATACSLGLLMIIHLIIAQMIDTQHDRNAYLKNQIQIVDIKIKKIDELNKTRRALIERMDVIQKLQQARPSIVHLFDEIAQTVPASVHLTKLDQDGSAIKISGMAESNASVSAYMLNVENSDWLAHPSLSVILSEDNKSFRNSQFSISLIQNSTSSGKSE